MNANKTCSICSLRPVASLQNRNEAGMSGDMDYCVPCFDEAGWENSHSDDDHEGFESLTVRQSSFRTKAELEAWKADLRETVKACWVCTPELNLAKRPYTPRQGTSRAGMTITVPIREAGEVKAEVVRVALTDERQNGRFEISIKTVKKTGEVFLSAKSAQESFQLRWDARGRFAGGTVSEGTSTRKVRNVAEVLRLAL